MKSKRVRHGQVALAVCGALLSAGTIAAAAGPRPLSVADSARLSALTLPEPISTEGNLPKVLHPSLAGLTGRHEVLIRLGGQSVAGSDESRSREDVAAEQAAAVDRILAVAPSADVRASLQLALNAVVMSVDAADLPAIARDTAITRIVGVSNYSQDLSETVPYIGADTAHALGARGQAFAESQLAQLDAAWTRLEALLP